MNNSPLKQNRNQLSSVNSNYSNKFEHDTSTEALKPQD
jgi:hypothetical protein